MPGIYPIYHSLVEKMAAKVITRVVSDGVALSDAIKETIKYADLNRQQVIHMCSILQDYGMVYNGDAKNYFHSTDEMGKAFPNAVDGYNVYAHNNGKLKTGTLNKVFDTIDELKKRGFADEEILAFNPDLGNVLTAINEAELKLNRIAAELDTRVQDSAQTTAPQLQVAPTAAPEVSNEAEPEEDLELAAMFSRDRIVIAQAADVAVEEPTDENVAQTLQDAAGEAPADDAISARDTDDLGIGGDEEAPVTDEEEFSDDLGGDDLGGDVSAKVRPTPSEIESRLADAPKWEVKNILSIQSAEKFYESLRKELEAVVFNENIVLDEDALAKYDGIRAKIDGEVDKINSAQKETKKLEEKETDLEEEFQEGETPAGAVPGELPTEEVISEEAAPEAPVAPAPAPAPKL